MVLTSAWAVGSLSRVTVLPDAAMILPSLTITAPNGPPWFWMFSFAIRMASSMNFLLYFMVVFDFLFVYLRCKCNKCDMAYFKKVVSIGDVLNTSLRKVVGPKSMEGLDAILVVKVWREMLGPTMLRYSENEVFENGALKVRIKSAVLRNDLFMQRTELISKLNERIGRKLVFAIIFR